MAPVMARRNFYLGGGTAIAIYLGHRRSVDFDWFTKEQMSDALRLGQELRDERVPLKIEQIDRGTLRGRIYRIPVSFLEYRYPLLKPPVLWVQSHCLIASLDDLVCMKLSALAQRGSRKDFVDIYALGLKHLSLKEMLRLYQTKYSVRDIGHVLYGLAYFDDADREKMPKMLWTLRWETVKETLRGWLKQIAR